MALIKLDELEYSLAQVIMVMVSTERFQPWHHLADLVISSYEAGCEGYRFT